MDIEQEQALKQFKETVRSWKDLKVSVLVENERKILKDILNDLIKLAPNDPVLALKRAIETIQQIHVKLPELPQAFNEIVLRFDLAKDKYEKQIREHKVEIENLNKNVMQMKAENGRQDSFDQYTKIVTLAKNDFKPITTDPEVMKKLIREVIIQFTKEIQKMKGKTGQPDMEVG